MTNAIITKGQKQGKCEEVGLFLFVPYHEVKFNCNVCIFAFKLGSFEEGRSLQDRRGLRPHDTSLRRRRWMLQTCSSIVRLILYLSCLTFSGVKTGVCMNSTRNTSLSVCEIYAWCPTEVDDDFPEYVSANFSTVFTVCFVFIVCIIFQST